jgi:hypothetical protein
LGPTGELFLAPGKKKLDYPDLSYMHYIQVPEIKYYKNCKLHDTFNPRVYGSLVSSDELYLNK